MNEFQEDIIGKKKNPWKTAGKILSIFFTSIILLCAGFLIQFEIRYEDFTVEGASMQPTLNELGALKSDIVYVNKYAKIKHEDIIVLQNHEKLDENGKPENWVKRVIALPGDEINIIGLGTPISQGNNTTPPKYLEYEIQLKKKDESEFKPLIEDYLSPSFSNMEIKFEQFWKYMKNRNDGIPTTEPLKIADDEFFALGDNRLNSNDSAINGPFKMNMLIGRVDFITKYILSNKEKQLKKLSYIFTIKI